MTLRIPESAFPGHVWRRHAAGDKNVSGWDLACWVCWSCEERAYTEDPYVKPDPDRCPRPTECGPICTLPTAEYPRPALHAHLDDVHLDDVIYWCEPAHMGRSRPRVFLGIRAVAARVVGNCVERERLHLLLEVINSEGASPFDAGRRITRTLDALAATGAFRAYWTAASSSR